MATATHIDDRSHSTADDEPARDIHSRPEAEGSSLTPAPPIPHDHHDRHDHYDTDFDLESADGRSVTTISTHSSETETVFSQNDESVTGPTGSAPSSKRRKGKGKETITVSSLDGSVAVDLKATLDTPRRSVPDLQTMDISSGNDGAGPNSNSVGDLVISPSMNFSTDWGGIPENAPASVDHLASFSVTDSVREGIDRFDADLSPEGMSSISSSGLGGDLVPTHTATVAAISAETKDGCSLKYTMIYARFLNMLSSRQMEELLNPDNWRDVCITCQQFPSNMLRFLSIPTPPAEPQYKIPSLLEEVVNCLFEMVMPESHEPSPGIRCRVRGPTAADPAALRFGLDRTIVLHSLQLVEHITFVCCDETFPSPAWAEKATEEFLKGARPWAKAGLKFKKVKRGMPAHFRIAFSLFPKDLDCSVLAQAFFPGTTPPEERTLWVYLLAFHPQYVDYMSGYMGHEAGHIGGSRHGFDEHILPDGSEISEWKLVTMGPDNPRSVMNYHDDPADYVVQPEDIRDMHSHAKDEYKEYKVIKVEPKAQAYLPMLSFECVMNYLLSKTRESQSPGVG
ncbi:hypothetical protein GGR55DRAFT_659771 [Xylaria sp. FL0064]|nr:hypothetical protein GGR55DRAFT_659771 [Xylaria sp. FL0064]